MSTNCCGANTLMVGRPTQAKYNQLCATSTQSGVSGCGGGATVCGNYTAPHNRTLGPRKHREKVREDIKDYVLLMLGAPTIKIELDTQALDLCVDQALKIFEDYAPREFFEWMWFNTTAGKSVYQLPDDVGIVREVVYKETPNFAFQSADLDGAIPIEYFYPGGAYASIQGGLIDPVQPMWGRAGEWTLYKSYEQMYSRISSNIGGWEWVSDMGYIKLYPAPCKSQRVMVHYLQKCKDWKEVHQAMQEGALAHAMIMLGHIRGKYGAAPGPGGPRQLDGEYMRQKGWELKEKWQEELITRYGDLPPITMG